jgi:hypothetical protein
MEVKPITNYKAPQYPTQSELKENDFVVSEVCHKWNHKVAKTSLLAATVMMALSGCNQTESSQMNVQSKISFQNQTANTQLNVVSNDIYEETYDMSEEAMELRSRRRVIKDGMLMLTPIAMPQPYRLTEEEAWEIIERKAKEAGLNLERETKKIDSITIDKKEYIEEIKDFAPEQDVKKLEKEIYFKIDGYDQEKKVGIEYVSADFDLGKKNLNSEELMSVYDITDIINNALAQKYPDENIKILRTDLYKDLRDVNIADMGEEKAKKELEAELDKFFDELREKGIID